ncbi:sulfatase-like hydrolase/transferase [Aestuariivivens sediminis]|uniref:sulfatase-like hydrolase/transferase n=1 Tax=Aestuariivivens sediminis TaxID=2913557 RepID=UPI001F5A2253|nr:sulfatase-like hydrolase/transferase [Aestuariivivens sediminis]
MMRQPFRTRPLSIALLVVLTAYACHNSPQNANRLPNVIIIYTDDQGTIDANCYGAKDLYTPNIDMLAETGVRFTQFYAAASVCSPSRAALLTGKTPLAAGLPGNAPSLEGEAGLPSEQMTIAEKLKAHGFVTGHIGKWHLGYSEETMPNGQGFDYSFGHMGGCIDNYSHFFYWDGPNRHDLWENNKEVWMDGAYFQDIISQKAVHFIQEHKDVPFFLYYAINLPHYPLQGTAKWREYYQHLESPRDKYAACVSTVDERIGIVLEKLEALKLRENTIVIFQSDQGHSMEERTFGGGGNAGQYRGAKFSLFEGGIRVPAIISWPGIIPQKQTRDQMAVNADWFPTILDMCNIEYRNDAFEGESLKEVIIANASTPHKAFWWYQNENTWAVRKEEWKLLKNPIDPSHKAPITAKDSLFLVNIQDDPSELTNLAYKHPEKVKELTQEYTRWKKTIK